jgi:hypothetical protein
VYIDLGGGLPVSGISEVDSIPEELLLGQGRILFYMRLLLLQEWRAQIAV